MLSNPLTGVGCFLSVTTNEMNGHHMAIDPTLTSRLFTTVRRMGQEQEDYLRKQEARRARAHDLSSSQYGDYHFRDHESLFNDFFAVSRKKSSATTHFTYLQFLQDREEWRRLVPNLSSNDRRSGHHAMFDMNELIRNAFEMTRNPRASKTIANVY